MKPLKTWILFANARAMHVLCLDGPGKALTTVANKRWQAEPAVEFSDRAGMGHSARGSGVSAVDQGDPQQHADEKFAKKVVAALLEDLKGADYARLVVVAGPHMLGLLRKAMPDEMRAVLVAEIDKDLSAASMDTVEKTLAKVLPI